MKKYIVETDFCRRTVPQAPSHEAAFRAVCGDGAIAINADCGGGERYFQLVNGTSASVVEKTAA